MLGPPDQSNMAKFDPDGHTAPLSTKTEGAMAQIKYNPQQGFARRTRIRVSRV